MENELYLFGGAILILLVLFFNNIKLKKEVSRLNKVNEKYSGIINIEEEQKRIKKENIELESKILSNKDRAKRILDKIFDFEKKLSVLEEELNFQDFGVYRPKYYFETSEVYKEELKKLNGQIKQIVKNKSAAICHTEWKVNNSVKEGKKATTNFLKLLLRAFNSECDAAISKVKYNNVHVMEARINKAFEMLNKMAEKTHRAEITYEYLNLRLNELYLTHEYHEKVQVEKEEQREIREQMREEEKAQKEYDKAQKEAEKEEQRYQKALEKAQKELEKAQGEKLEKLNTQIEKLKNELELAKQNKERAVSMAQLTKSGHVYVVSNIGSFGENVYKIGMTRRLEPNDRVKELSNASVPFNFDIHAMIYSKNAPELERELHKQLEEKRVNKVNLRREFFNVSLDKIQKIVEDLHGVIWSSLFVTLIRIYTAKNLFSKGVNPFNVA